VICGRPESLTNARLVQGQSARGGRRFLAALIDWVACLIVPLVVLPGIVTVPGGFASLLWVVLAPLGIVVYFAFSLVHGRTLGMRAASLRIVDERTGRAPSAGKALARSLVALLQAAAVFALLNLAFSDTPTDGYSAADFAVLAASSLIAVTAFLGHLWMFLERQRRTVLDRLFRLAIEGSPPALPRELS
jgi:uncharacterized RDD family membrane protein YckC